MLPAFAIEAARCRRRSFEDGGNDCVRFQKRLRSFSEMTAFVFSGSCRFRWPVRLSVSVVAAYKP
jgi:hypothetical protein